MRIDVSPLLEGASAAPLDFAFDMAGLPPEIESSAGIRAASPFRVAGVVTGDHANKLIRCECRAHIPFETQCARCAADISSAVELSFSRFVTVDPEGEDAVSESFILAEGGYIDADALVCEFLLLELPGRFLCREDCRGLCSSCGKDLNEGDCDCPKKEIDPRLKILDKFFEDGE